MEVMSWQMLHDQLCKCPWFESVGREIAPNNGKLFTQVKSWTEAASWSKSEMSWWCSNEATNVLSLDLHYNHHDEYQEWNNYVYKFRPALDEILNNIIKKAIPSDVYDKCILEWIETQLVGAYLECCYSSLSKVNLICNHVEWFLKGHFPCGWTVDSEDGFPDKAIIVLY